MKKAVIYARVSTGDQVEGASLDNQVFACQQWAAANGIVVQRTYIEQGVSAKTLKRPKMQEMLAYLAENKNEIDYLVTYQTDRLTRSATDFLGLRALLGKLGIEYKNTNNSTAIHDYANEKMVNSLQAIIAEWDNDLKAVRTRDNMKRHAADGWRMNKAPYGLKNHRDAAGKSTLIPDDDLADLVAYLLEEFAKGLYNMKQLLAEAHKIGLKTAGGKAVSYQWLQKLLTNPIYAGLDKNAFTDGTLIKSNFKGIITPATYYRNQDILAARRDNKPLKYVVNNPAFPLRRLLSCATCNSPLRGSSPIGRSGKAYPKYHCQNKNCTSKARSVSNDLVHEHFIQLLDSFKLDERVARLYKQLVVRVWNEEAQDMIKRRQRLQERISKLETLKHKALDRFINGEVSKEEKDGYIRQTNAEVILLQSQVSELSQSTELKQSVIEHALDYLSDTAAVWKQSDVETQTKFQAMLFPNGVQYDLTTGIFRTSKISEFYRLASIQKGAEAPDVSSLVTPRRVELLLPG